MVAPAKKPKGRFTVEAGGRRLRALASLAEEGKLGADHEVCYAFPEARLGNKKSAENWRARQDSNLRAQA